MCLEELNANLVYNQRTFYVNMIDLNPWVNFFTHFLFFSFLPVPLSSTSPVQSVLPVAFLMLEKTKIPSNPGCLSSFTNRVEDKWPHDQ